MSTTAAEKPSAETPGPDPDEGGGGALTFDALAVMAFAIALIAIVIAVFAVGLATRAIDEHRATPLAPSGASASASVALDEFTISPAPLEVPSGGSVSVTNDGTAVHDLVVEGQDIQTPELNPGDEADLDLSGLQPGAYTIFCQIPGHRESGMESELTVG
jgi:plastocyanin